MVGSGGAQLVVVRLRDRKGVGDLIVNVLIEGSEFCLVLRLQRLLLALTGGRGQ